MNQVERRDIKQARNWESLSPKLRQLIILSNALPENLRVRRGQEGPRKDQGVDAQREKEVNDLSQSLTPEENEQYQDYIRRKRQYFISYIKDFFPLVELLKKQGFVGKTETDLKWRPAFRRTIVLSEFSGDIAEVLRDKGQDINPDILRVAGMVYSITKREQAKQSTAKNDYAVLRERIVLGAKLLREWLIEPANREVLNNTLPVLRDEQAFENFIRAIQDSDDIGSVEFMGTLEGAKARDKKDAEQLNDLTTKILYYVHHVLKHSAIVSVKERIDDATERYVTDEQRTGNIYKEITNRGRIAQRVEAEIAADLGIKPEQMQEYLAKIFFEKLYR